jgi:hypothetical protein
VYDSFTKGAEWREIDALCDSELCSLEEKTMSGYSVIEQQVELFSSRTRCPLCNMYMDFIPSEPAKTCSGCEKRARLQELKSLLSDQTEKEDQLATVTPLFPQQEIVPKGGDAEAQAA